MPADTVEIVEGDEEGVERLNGWGPVEIERNAAGDVIAVVFRRCLRVYDEARRFSPAYDDEERLRFPATRCCCRRTGADVDLPPGRRRGSRDGPPGLARIDAATLATSAPGVFVAGDLPHGTRLLIDAVASGKPRHGRLYLSDGRPLDAEYLELHLVEEGYRREPGYESIRRVPVPLAPPAERLSHPDAMVEVGYDEPSPARSVALPGLRRDAGVRRLAVRAVRRLRDVCPTLCLKIVTLDRVAVTPDLRAAVGGLLGDGVDLAGALRHSQGRRPLHPLRACVMRCPTDAIKMDRVACSTTWRTA